MASVDVSVRVPSRLSATLVEVAAVSEVRTAVYMIGCTLNFLFLSVVVTTRYVYLGLVRPLYLSVTTTQVIEASCDASQEVVADFVREVIGSANRSGGNVMLRNEPKASRLGSVGSESACCASGLHWQHCCRRRSRPDLVVQLACVWAIIFVSGLQDDRKTSQGFLSGGSE